MRDRGGLVRTAGLVVLGVAAAAVVGALVIRDQFSRHSRNLFSPQPLRRLAALGYLHGRDATVEGVQLLRDFVAWEPRPLLRKRAGRILDRMEAELQAASPSTGELAG